MMVLPAMSMTGTPAGTGVLEAGPMASIRLPSTMMTPFSITSVPFMVISRAPVRAMRPSGLSAWALKPRLIPVSSGAGSSSGAPSTKVKAWFRSRVNSCGPSDHCSRCESPDQLSHSPASRVTRACGRDLPSALMATGRPAMTKGAT